MKARNVQVIRSDNKDCDVLLIREDGKTVALKWNEFWAICREGERIDTSEEAESYLSQCDALDGIAINDTTITEESMKQIVEEVIKIRSGNDCGDDIYDATIRVLHKNGFSAYGNNGEPKEE